MTSKSANDGARQNKAGAAEKTSLEMSPSAQAEDTRPTTAVEETNATAETGAGKALGGKLDFGFLPIPPRLRYVPEKTVHFGILLNAIFGFASTFGTPLHHFHGEVSQLTIKAPSRCKSLLLSAIAK